MNVDILHRFGWEVLKALALLEPQVIEYTSPEKPGCRLQKVRLAQPGGRG